MAQPLTVEPAAAEFDFYKLPRRRKLRSQARLLKARRDLRAKGLEFRQVRHQLRWFHWQAVSEGGALPDRLHHALTAADEMDRCLRQLQAAITDELGGSDVSNTREPNTARPRQVRRATTTARSGSDSDPPGLPQLGLHWTQAGLKLSELTLTHQNGGRS